MQAYLPHVAFTMFDVRLLQSLQIITCGTFDCVLFVHFPNFRGIIVCLQRLLKLMLSYQFKLNTVCACLFYEF